MLGVKGCCLLHFWALSCPVQGLYLCQSQGVGKTIHFKAALEYKMMDL